MDLGSCQVPSDATRSELQTSLPLEEAITRGPTYAPLSRALSHSEAIEESIGHDAEGIALFIIACIIQPLTLYVFQITHQATHSQKV